MPNTSKTGNTPEPKLAAKPTIHSSIASVKIVQNKGFLLNLC
jgi:hypothetical protein